MQKNEESKARSICSTASPERVGSSSEDSRDHLKDDSALDQSSATIEGQTAVGRLSYNEDESTQKQNADKTPHSIRNASMSRGSSM